MTDNLPTTAQCVHQLDYWGNYCVKCHKRYLLPTKDKDGFGVSYAEWDKQRLKNMNRSAK